jgi:hypothetical protein
VVNVECENDLQEDLYHYTDFAALKSMYEKGEIWATNSQYLNDISEMQLGPKAIMGVVVRPMIPIGSELSQMQSLGLSGLTTEEKNAALRDIVETIGPYLQRAKGFSVERFKELVEACQHAMKDTTCFVFSLSKEPDQLSQWRAYANDGVCIGFSAKALCENLRSAAALRARMRSVRYYDEKATVEEHAKLEDYARPIIDWAGERRGELIAAGEDEATRKVIIGQELMTRLAFVKDFHFEEEREVRIAVQGNPDHFTTPHRYGIVPQMKLPITSDAIKKVIVGPAAHAELRVQSLQTFFENCGFKNDPNKKRQIEVSRSSIPYRDW